MALEGTDVIEGLCAPAFGHVYENCGGNDSADFRNSCEVASYKLKRGSGE